LFEIKDSDEAGPLERLRSQICDNVAMYAQKYDEEFQVRISIASFYLFHCYVELLRIIILLEIISILKLTP